MVFNYIIHKKNKNVFMRSYTIRRVAVKLCEVVEYTAARFPVNHRVLSYVRIIIGVHARRVEKIAPKFDK